MATKKFKKGAGKKSNYRRRKFSRKSKRSKVPVTAKGGSLGGTVFPGSLLSSGNVAIQRTLNPFPDSYICRLHYSNTQSLTAVNGNTASVTQYRLNSLYDPYYPSGGTQPYFYDQLTAVYSVYRVHGVYVKLTFFNPEADETIVGYRVRSLQNTTATSGQNVRLLCQQKNTQMKTLVNSGSQKAEFSGYIPIHKVFGITKGQYLYDQSFAASSVSADPNLTALIEPFIIDMGNGMTKTCWMTISMTWNCQFSGFYSPAES